MGNTVANVNNKKLADKSVAGLQNWLKNNATKSRILEVLGHLNKIGIEVNLDNPDDLKQKIIEKYKNAYKRGIDPQEAFLQDLNDVIPNNPDQIGSNLDNYINNKSDAYSWRKAAAGVGKIALGGAILATAFVPPLYPVASAVATGLYTGVYGGSGIIGSSIAEAAGIASLGAAFAQAVKKGQVEKFLGPFYSPFAALEHTVEGLVQRVQASFETNPLKKQIKLKDSENSFHLAKGNAKVFAGMVLSPALLVVEGIQNVATGREAKYGLGAMLKYANKSFLMGEKLIDGQYKFVHNDQTKRYREQEEQALLDLKEFQRFDRMGMVPDKSKMLKVQKNYTKIKLERLKHENEYNLLTKGEEIGNYQKIRNKYKNEYYDLKKELTIQNPERTSSAKERGPESLNKGLSTHEDFMPKAPRSRAKKDKDGVGEEGLLSSNKKSKDGHSNRKTSKARKSHSSDIKNTTTASQAQNKPHKRRSFKERLDSERQTEQQPFKIRT